MEQKNKMLADFTNANGISGYEKTIKKMMVNEFEKLGVEVKFDNIGSVVGSYVGDTEGPKVAVVGHMDEIGFIVTKITDEGFLKFQTIGGWWSQVMLAQEYDVTTCEQKVYRAVMGSKPPHLLTPEERNRTVDIENMYLDLGVDSKDEVLALGVKPGDMITPAIKFQEMANPNYLLAKAFDNRIGCVIALDVMKNLKGTNTPNTVMSMGSVQEEVGCRGAKTLAQMTEPDIVFALDVTIATDTPGLSGNCKMGKGPAILLYDGGLIGHPDLRQFVVKVAEELKIPYQLDYLARGGTDAGPMHLAHNGAPAMSLCVPSRYIHSHTSMIHREDYENTVLLITEVIKRLDKKAYLQIVHGE